MQSFKMERPCGVVLIKSTPEGFVLTGDIVASEMDAGIARNTIRVDGDLYIDKPVAFPLLERVSGLLAYPDVKTSDLVSFPPLTTLRHVGVVGINKTTSRLFPALETAEKISVSEGVFLPSFQESRVFKALPAVQDRPAPLDGIRLPSFQKTKTLIVVGEGVPEVLDFPQLREVSEFIGYKFADLRKGCPQLSPPSDLSGDDLMVGKKPKSRPVESCPGL